MIMDNNKILTGFKDFENTLAELKSSFGVMRLLNIEVENPLIITNADIIMAIKKYNKGEISTQTLVDWVNTLWFTDLYDYSEEQINSIASVMDKLEELDEEGVVYSEENFAEMIMALENNREYSGDSK
jgi:hypothetical protein